MRDVDGRVQKVRVDVSWVPGLLDAPRHDAHRRPGHGGAIAAEG